MKTAIALVGFNRPQYFEECTASLAKNDLSGHDVFCFVDGGKNSKADEYAEILDKSGIKIKNFLPQPDNVGCGRHMIYVRELLLEERKYDRLLIIEDDVVVTKTYVKFMSVLADWGYRQPNVGVISGFSPIKTAAKDVLSASSDVFMGDSNWISYLISRDVWRTIRSDMLEYRDTFLLDCDYHSRNHNMIRNWIYAKTVNCPSLSQSLPDCVRDFWKKQTAKFLNRKSATGQDGVTCAMLFRHGLAKMATRLNRCRHIGIYGQHARPHHPGTQELAAQELHECSLDGGVRSFQWWCHQ